MAATVTIESILANGTDPTIIRRNFALLARMQSTMGDAINTNSDHGNLAGLADDDHAQYALLSGRNGDTLNIDTINEFNTGAGVTVDGVLLKDGGAYFTSPVEIAAGTSGVRALTLRSTENSGELLEAYNVSGIRVLNLSTDSNNHPLFTISTASGSAIITVNQTQGFVSSFDATFAQDATVSGSLFVDLIRENGSGRILLGDDTRVNGNLEVRGSLEVENGLGVLQSQVVAPAQDEMELQDSAGAALAAFDQTESTFPQVRTDTIVEDTPAAGVTIDSVLLKDGLVDGRDVAADGTKLDGIESGATADQTPAEILAALLTVDGVGSGLDADLLDGQEGSHYLAWANLTGVPSTFTPSAHTHTTSDITDLASYTGFDARYYTETEADALLAAKLDSSSYTAADVLAKLLTVDGDGSGLDTDLIQGSDAQTVIAGLRANCTLIGGGTLSVSATGYVKNSSRILSLANGRGSHYSTSGYFDINIPTSGTVTGVGGATNKTATSDGVPLDTWEALYYILPIGTVATSVAANFRVVKYTGDIEIPAHWVRIVTREGDGTNRFEWFNGIQLSLNQSIDTNSYDARAAFTAGFADLLDNQHGAYYLDWANFTGVPSTFTPSAHTHVYTEITNWNAGISAVVDKAFVDALNVDADTLDGLDSTAFALAGHTHSYVPIGGGSLATSTGYVKFDGITFAEGFLWQKSDSLDSWNTVVGSDAAFYFGFAGNATGADDGADFSVRFGMRPEGGIYMGPPGVRSDTYGYARLNYYSAASTTQLSSGLLVYASGDYYGLDLGHEVAGTYWGTRIFHPNSQWMLWASHANGVEPTAQSSFTHYGRWNQDGGFLGFNKTGGSTSPFFVDLGSSYSTAAADNLKLRVYNDFAGTEWGFGISSNQMDYVVGPGSGFSHAFYTGNGAGGHALRFTIGDSLLTAINSNFAFYYNTGVWWNTSAYDDGMYFSSAGNYQLRVGSTTPTMSVGPGYVGWANDRLHYHLRDSNTASWQSHFEFQRGSGAGANGNLQSFCGTANDVSAMGWNIAGNIVGYWDASGLFIPSTYRISLGGINASDILISSDGASTSDTALVSAGYVAAHAASDLVAISTTTVTTGVSSVDFTLPSGYESFVLVVSHAEVANDGTGMQMRVSTDGGSTFKSGASDYTYNSVITSASASSGAYGSGSADSIQFANNGIGNAANEQFSATFEIHAPSSAGHQCVTYTVSYSEASGTQLHQTGAGTYKGASVDAVQLLPGSGNIDAGVFTLYGRKAA